MKIHVRIINLERSTVRKAYMDALLAEYKDIFDIDYVPAIDGRLMSESVRENVFDYGRSLLHYGRRMNAGEVGCALSHRKCYTEMLDANDLYCLILEDDVYVVRDLHQLDIEAIDALANSPKPRVIYLSGDYWYFRKKSLMPVYSAVGAYAYIINRAAAELILSIDKPYSVADDWMVYKRLGVRLYAVNPYMLDANVNMELLSSDVKQDDWGINRKLMSKKEVFVGYLTGAVKKFLKATGKFEYKTNIFENKVAPKKTNPFK